MRRSCAPVLKEQGNMKTRVVTLLPGRTYIMRTGKHKTIIFEFIGMGHYRVNGGDRHVDSYHDLALPGAVTGGPHDYQQ